VQRDRHAIAGKGRDDGGLIAQIPKSVAVRSDVAVRNRCNRKRAFPARRGAGEPPIEMRTGRAQRAQQFVPGLSNHFEILAAHDETEIGDAAVDRLKPGVSTGK
jgi:hypothetical protein